MASSSEISGAACRNQALNIERDISVSNIVAHRQSSRHDGMSRSAGINVVAGGGENKK